MGARFVFMMAVFSKPLTILPKLFATEFSRRLATSSMDIGGPTTQTVINLEDSQPKAVIVTLSSSQVCAEAAKEGV